VIKDGFFDKIDNSTIVGTLVIYHRLCGIYPRTGSVPEK